MRKLVLSLVALALAFGYGFVCHRNRLFPYDSIHALWSRLASDSPGDSAPAPDRRPGMWVRVQSDAADGDSPDMGAIRDLAGMGYMDGYEPAPDASGVTMNAEGATHPGLNLVLSGHAPEAVLMDMAGGVLHRWSARPGDVWPELAEEDMSGHHTFWRRARVEPDGSLLAIYDGIGMIRLTRDSQLEWANMGGMHHDLDLDQEGRIYTLSRARREEHDRLTLTGPIQEDFVSVLSPEGEELRRVSVLDCFLDSDYYSIVSLAAKRGDILHTNTIERMDGRFADRHPMFTEGHLLISAPTVNTIAVIDLEAERVVWALTGMFQFQHQPTVLDNGHLLVFDNLGQNGRSKVIEFDALTQEIAWAFRDSPRRGFSSYFLGSCQRLPNRNTLITESAAGRAFEVNHGGEIVWEYVNPHHAGEEDELIATLLEVVRIERGYFTEDFLAALQD